MPVGPAVWVLTRFTQAERCRSWNTPCGTGRTVTSLWSVDLRDDQPMKHEIGNRTFIVADVEPLDVDGVRTIEVGTITWLIGFVALLPFYSRLEDDGHTWWLWTCLAGFGLGPVRAGVLPPAPERPRRARGTSRRARLNRWSVLEASTSSMLRVSKTGSGSGWGSCLLASRTSEWAPQPWSSATTRPSSLASPLAQTPKVSASGPAIGPGSRRCGRVRARTGRAASRGRRRRRTSARRPRRGPRRRACAPGRGRGPGRPRGSAPCRRSRAGRRRRSTSGPAAGRRRSTGSRSPGDRSPGWMPLAVGHPGRGDDRLVAGEQHDLVDGDRASAAGRG